MGQECFSELWGEPRPGQGSVSTLPKEQVGDLGENDKNKSNNTLEKC